MLLQRRMNGRNRQYTTLAFLPVLTSDGADDAIQLHQLLFCPDADLYLISGEKYAGTDHKDRHMAVLNFAIEQGAKLWVTLT